MKKFTEHIIRVMPLIIIVLSLFTIAAGLLQDVPEFGTLEEILVWVTTKGGAMVLAGIVVALLLENLGFWHRLPRSVKVLIVWVLAGLFTAAAQFAIDVNLPGFVPPYIESLVLILINWLFSQIGYQKARSAGYAASAKG